MIITEVLARTNNVALISREKQGAVCPYVVAVCDLQYDPRPDKAHPAMSWGFGHYFVTREAAERDYREMVKKYG